MASQDNKSFYDRCAELLGVEHEHRPFRHGRRNRWNNREPGSGRFPGRGLIRLFGSRVHVALHQPVGVNRWFDDRPTALAQLERLVATGAA
jgi:hypothetical protein